jgi:hypothetical protein
MRSRRLFYWLRDRVWATVVARPKAGGPPAFEWPNNTRVETEAVEASYNALKEELKAEDDRFKIVETKLLSVSTFVPVAMTITVAIVTFLTSGRVSQFTRTSILIVGTAGGYAALQFLRAALAAVNGLGRRSFAHMEIKDIAPRPNEKKEQYLQRACAQMVSILCINREGINKKVSQLALAHESIKNALWGLLVVLLATLVIVARGSQP